MCLIYIIPFIGLCCCFRLVDIRLVSNAQHYFIQAFGFKITFHSFRSECSVKINSTEYTCELNTIGRISTYFGLTLMVIVLSFIRYTLLFVLLLRASRVLHNRMFKAVLRVPVHFFDTNPIGKGSLIKINDCYFCFYIIIGRILNRFTQDISFMDVQLSLYFTDFVTVRL